MEPRRIDESTSLTNDWLSALIGSDELLLPERQAARELEVARTGVRELHALLHDPVFEERFVENQTSRELAAIHRLEQAIDRSLIFSLKLDAERDEFSSRGEALTKNELKAAARRRVRVTLHSKIYDLKDPDQLQLLRMAVAEGDRHYRPLLNEALVARAKRLDFARQTFQRLKSELDSQCENPELLEAMTLWGRSRNAIGDANAGAGYHAGVVHYFEYRGYSGKNKRFRDENLEQIGIRGFIDFTNSARVFLRPTSEISPEYGIIFQDESGRKRLIARTDSSLMIAFQYPGEPFRLLSLQPNKPGWRTREKVLDRIKRELAPCDEDKRFNRLGSGRSLIASIGSGNFLFPE